MKKKKKKKHSCAHSKKNNPPKCDKLRPVSLSDCFAKVAETFITDWILKLISGKIDLQQYGNFKGVSTSHYLG